MVKRKKYTLVGGLPVWEKASKTPCSLKHRLKQDKQIKKRNNSYKSLWNPCESFGISTNPRRNP